MLVLVNASNQGRPLGQRTLDEVRSVGAHGIRTDIWPEDAEEQLREFREHPDLQLLALIHGGKMPGNAKTLFDEAEHAATIARENLRMHELPHPPFFELGNEPNIATPRHWHDADVFGRAVADAARVIWRIMGPNTLVISGGVHTPGKKPQKYLAKAVRHFPRDEGRFAIGFHDYAPGMGDPDTPQDGYDSVDDQIASLRKHGYPLFDTESGGHTAPRENHSEDEIARWLKRRLDLSRKWELLGSVVFQIQDGPDATNYEDRFGLFRLEDRSWKLSALALKGWMDEHRGRA